MTVKEVDQKVLSIVKNFKKAEAELLDIIGEVDRFKVYRKLGYSSLFQYCIQRLKLSESQTYGFISVARKSLEVPQIKKSIKEGKLTISKAKRITSVITKENHNHWIDLASQATQRKVEREVALANPQKATIEKMTYTSPFESISEKVQIKQCHPSNPRVKLEVGLSEKTMLKLRRAQDILSQKNRKSANLEQTIDSLLDEYLKRHDPVEKAKRQKIKGKLRPQNHDSKLKSKTKPSLRKVSTKPSQKKSGREPLPAKLKHQVYLAADGRCMATDSLGKRCASRRFLEIHHIKPVSVGGKNNIENLALLCSGHHAVYHQE